MQRAWHVRAASCLPTPKYLCQGRQGAAAGDHHMWCMVGLFCLHFQQALGSRQPRKNGRVIILPIRFDLF